MGCQPLQAPLGLYSMPILLQKAQKDNGSSSVLVGVWAARFFTQYTMYESFSPPEVLKMVAHSPSSSFSVCPFQPKLTFSTAKQEQQWQIMFWKKGVRGESKMPLAPLSGTTRPERPEKRRAFLLTTSTCHLGMEGYCRVGLFHSIFTVVPLTLSRLVLPIPT